MKLKQQVVDSLKIAMRMTIIQIVMCTTFAGTLYAKEATEHASILKTFTVSLNNKESNELVKNVQKRIGVKFGYSHNAIKADSIYSNNFGYPQVVTNKVPFDNEIQGVVKDERGEPMLGASVAIKGTAIGVITDKDGAFKLRSPSENSILIISFTGYLSQEKRIGNQVIFSIQLLPIDNKLNEVVVVGYGTQRKKDLTGAIAQIKADDFKGYAVTGFDQAIQGKVAGVTVVSNSGEPGGSVSIKIRGVGSINGNSDPLYIIDGIPSDGGLNSINPNDIETIDIMKDASASAIYGSRASNGVVIVTTRKGKAGNLQANFDNYAGTQAISKKLQLLNTEQLFSLANEAILNQQKDPRYSTTPVAGAGPNPAFRSTSDYPNTDWQDAIFQSGSIQSYNVSMLGGSDKFKSSTMLGYYKMNGVLLNSFYNRYTVRSNNSYDIKKWLRGGFTVGITNENSNTISTDRVENASISALQLATRAVPYMPVNVPDGYGIGTPGSLFYGYNNYAFLGRKTTSDVNGQFYYPNNLYNPVYNLSNAVQNPNKNWRLLGGTYMEIEPITALKVRSTLNIDYGTANGFYGEIPVSAETNIGQQDGIAYFSDNRNFTWNSINTITYDKKLGLHHFNILAGTDVLKYTGNVTRITGAGYEFGEKFVPDNANSRTVSSYEISNALVSYLGRITYDYSGRYLFAFNIRNDGSSRFGPQNQFGTFPSASAGWVLSEESFIKKITFINSLKLRGSYGILGNQKIPDFRYLSTYSPRDNVNYAFFPIRYPFGSTNSGYQATQNGVALGNLANEAIQWESSSQLDFGIDGTFFSNKLNLNLDYYKKKLYNLLGNEPVPITFGSPSGSRFGNFAALENTGWEFTMGWQDKIGEVNFGASINASLTNNKVTNIGNSSDISSGFGLLGFASTRTIVGQPIAQYYGFLTDGIYQNQTDIDNGPLMPSTVVPGDRRFKDISGPDGKPDGKVTELDRTYLGNGFPKWTGGINLRADYKGFDINLFVNGQFGSKVAADWMNYAYNIRNYNGGGFQNASVDMLNRWQKEGDITDIPRLGYDQTVSNYWFSDFYVRKNDYVRLRNLQIGYSFAPTTISKLGITKARIYVSGQNLLTITGYNGYDPEIGVRRDDSSTSNQILLTGVDSGRYPSARSFILGINLSF